MGEEQLAWAAAHLGAYTSSVPIMHGHAMKLSHLKTLCAHPLAHAGVLLFTVAALATASVYGTTVADVLPGDAVRGKAVYQACAGCHSLDQDELGPRHRGVVGRPAGSVPGYAYSPALKNAHIVWDPVSLDRWLTNPQGLVPGAKMFFAIPNAQDRLDVIAYLAEQR